VLTSDLERWRDYGTACKSPETATTIERHANAMIGTGTPPPARSHHPTTRCFAASRRRRADRQRVAPAGNGPLVWIQVRPSRPRSAKQRSRLRRGSCRRPPSSP